MHEPGDGIGLADPAFRVPCGLVLFAVAKPDCGGTVASSGGRGAIEGRENMAEVYQAFGKRPFVGGVSRTPCGGEALAGRPGSVTGPQGDRRELSKSRRAF